ncbi:hypothetical protein [Desulfosarcina ovata]|uniref:CRISPR-associated RAMP protein Csx10 n=1 Tax=Desulfosarcina ovata subsp. ovata TaxID=2752305 RepID=A0A5K8A3W3_9BACT|nr:hypothetical protein [Desulfosarcina ovata]BBO87235.1 hypothetical protein DSCOOX_04150 [Desulfosarcina ovata subsp. ovata]
MKRFQLTLELLEDAIFSARAATLGGHRSLDYIPGAVLYGVSASKLYRSLGKDAFLAFHSDKVRFGNGYPVAPNGETGYPMPFAWHVVKGKTFLKESDPRLVDGTKIYSDLFKKIKKDKQSKQLRDGYVTASGLFLQPQTTFRMKTAINPIDGTAAEAQLFGYEAIEAGQKFHAYLDFDDDIGEALIDDVCSSLKGTILIGRSRSAQYGKAGCKIGGMSSPQQPSFTGNSMTLFLLSDLCLEDSHGMPALWPSAELFGLKSGSFNTDKSFLRFRHYSPYNTARRHHDNERHVIQQGSVVTFDHVSDGDDFSHFSCGMGSHRGNGLGQVLVQPDWLFNPGSSAEAPEACSRDIEEPKNDPLVLWLKSRVETGSAKRADQKLAEKMNKELGEMYGSARKYLCEPEGTLVGPGKTQWGLVLDAGKRFSNDMDRFFKELEKICRSKEDKGPTEEGRDAKTQADEAWSVETGSAPNITFGKWLIDYFRPENKQDMRNPCRVAATLARLAIDTAALQTKRESVPKPEEKK